MKFIAPNRLIKSIASTETDCNSSCRLSLRLRSMDLIKSYGGIKLYTYVSELEKHLEVLTVQRSEAY